MCTHVYFHGGVQCPLARTIQLFGNSGWIGRDRFDGISIMGRLLDIMGRLLD